MKIIRPTTITDAILTSSTVAETDYAAYNAATTYALGDRVIVTTGVHKIYESLQAGNVGHAVTDDSWWLEISATNRWKVFDGKIADQTSNATSINYVLAPGAIDAIALLNMDATSVQITLTDPTYGVVYDQTIDLVSTSNVVDGYTYFFEPIIRRTALALLDIPPYSAASGSITIANTGGTAKVGEIVLGRQSDIGETEYGPSIGIIDYSKKEADTFGNYIVLERAYSKRISCQLFLLNGKVDEVVRQLELYRATPLVWVAAEDFSSLIVYGFYKSFDIVIPGPTVSNCSLEIEGLT
jgi:hypothetical protein